MNYLVATYGPAFIAGHMFAVLIVWLCDAYRARRDARIAADFAACRAASKQRVAFYLARKSQVEMATREARIHMLPDLNAGLDASLATVRETPRGRS